GTFVMPDDEALEEWLSLPLLHFTASGRTLTWTIDDFRREAGYTDPEHRSQVRNAEDLQDFIEGVVTRQALLMEARAAGLDQHPDLPVALREAMTGWLAGGARARITNELETDDAVRALQEQIDALRQRFDVEVRLDRLTSLALSAN